MDAKILHKTNSKQNLSIAKMKVISTFFLLRISNIAAKNETKKVF
jgi:hypothetical protein